MGVISFSSSAYLSVKLSSTNEVAELKSKIDALPYLGEKTNLRAGLSLARSAFAPANGARPFAYKAVVLVYDGENPTPEFGTLMSEAPKLRNWGADVSVVSLDYYFSKGLATKTLVESIASMPYSTHLFTDLPNWTKLTNTVAPTILANMQDSCMRKNKAMPVPSPLTGAGTSTTTSGANPTSAQATTAQTSTAQTTVMGTVTAGTGQQSTTSPAAPVMPGLLFILNFCNKFIVNLTVIYC